MATKNFYVHDGLKVRGNTLLNGTTYSAAPSAKLHVKTSASVGANLTNVNGLIIENGGSSTNYAFKVATGCGNIFNIQNNGYVGLGTVSPNENLTVVGNISASGSLYGNIEDLTFDSLTISGDLNVGGTVFTDVLSAGTEIESPEFIGNLRGAVSFTAKAGEALTKGDAVYISGISGNTTVVGKADADDSSKMPAFGIANESVSLNASVTIINFGAVTNLDTSSYPEGTELYVSTTAGALTSAAPTGESSLLQKIAKVTRQDNAAGSMTVMGAGRTNAVPNLNEGSLFVGNSANQAVADNTLFVDIANSEVGINNVSPDRALHVKPTSNVPAIKVGYDGTQGNGSLIEFDNGYTQKFYVGMSDTYASRDFVIAEVSLGSSTDATNPKYVFNGNGDGAFSITDAADNDTRVLLNTNGDSYLSGGNVGIGTSSPGAALDVNGTLRVQNNNSSSNYMEFTAPGSWNVVGSRPVIKVGGTEKMRASANGVNIGGSTDATHTLDVDGAAHFSSDVTISGDILNCGDLTVNGNLTVQGTTTTLNTTVTATSAMCISNAGTGPALQLNQTGSQPIVDFQDDGSSAFYIEDGGNVGIGTNNPGTALDVVGVIQSQSVSNNQYGELRLNNGSYYIQGGQYMGDIRHIAPRHRFFHETSSTLLANFDLNQSYLCNTCLGIGTASPTQQLQVAGAIKSTSYFISETAANAAYFDQAGTDARITSKGADVDTLGGFKVLQQASDGVPNNTPIEVETNGDVLLAQSSGNVGIGTTSPLSELHIEKSLTGDSSQLRITNGAGATVRMGITGSGANDSAHIKTNSGEDLEFQIGQAADAATPSVIFKSGGDVGIGTPSPSTILDVNGTITLSSDVEHQLAKRTQSCVTAASADTTELRGRNIDLYAFDDINLRAGTGDKINLFAQGGSTKFTVCDDVVVNPALCAINFRVGGDTDANLIRANGALDKVGIGVAFPNEKFTVSGNISASGIIYGDTFCSNSGSSSTIDFNDNLDVDGYITASNYIATTNTSTTSAMVMGFKDQFKRTYTTEYSFTQSGAGLHTFNLAFPSPWGGGLKYKAVLIIQRQGSAYTFGSIEDNSYIYRESDNDFTHRSEDQVLVSSGLGSSNSVVLSGDISSFNTDVLTSSSTTGSSTYDYYVVRYPLDFNYNFSGTNKIMVHLETYNYSGPDPVFTIA